MDERLEKITDLDKKVNSDDLIYRYRGNAADVKFDEFDNALNFINKIQNGEIRLADVKNNQEKFKLIGFPCMCKIIILLISILLG